MLGNLHDCFLFALPEVSHHIRERVPQPTLSTKLVIDQKYVRLKLWQTLV